jgi:CBS domain-containing protein
MIQRKAKDIMSTNVVTAGPDMLVIDVIKTLLHRHISGLPVVDDDGNLLGIITEHDIVNFILSGNAAETKALEVMSRTVQTYAPDTPFEEIVNHFAAHRIRRVPVVEGGKVVGIISRRDIIVEMNRIYDRLVVRTETKQQYEEG